MNIINKIEDFLADENGAETVEWVIIAAIMTGIAIAAYQTSLKAAIATTITTISNKLTAAF